jgi:O-antigen/teichoic acid export membrane protein
MTTAGSGPTTPRQQGSASASALATVGAVVTMASNFLIAWLVSRGGADLAGLFFVATAVVAIAGNSCCLGTMTGLVYFLPQALDTDSPNPRSLILLALRPVLVVAVSVAVALFLLASPLAELVAAEQAAEITSLFHWLAVVIPPWALTVTLLGATRGLGTMTPTVTINQVMRPALQIFLLAIVLTDRTPPAWQLAAAWGTPVILGFIAALATVGRRGGVGGGAAQRGWSRE